MLSLNITATALALLWISLLASLALKREKKQFTVQLEEQEEQPLVVKDISERYNPVSFSLWYEFLESVLEVRTKIIFNPQWYRASEEYKKFDEYCKDRGVTVLKEHNLDFQRDRSAIHFDDPLLMPLLWNKGYNIKFVKGKSFTDLLKEVAPFTLIFLSVKDDGSQALNHKWQEKLADYGVQKLTREFLRSSYINVIWKKGEREYISLHEEVSDKAISKTIESGYKVKEFIMPIHLEVKSAGYNSGNVSSVKIEGLEYSPNLRGMNIIVYDLIDSKVKSVHRVDTFVSIFEDNTIYCAYPEEEKM
ncbi:interleukin-like EMT inducer domain-containing protein [Paenibacillus sp. F6_3S_P_1C]|uniref:Interleukin-like EMT inducer domain-containing protein n=1 Tax=Paenibacillus vandeheii TaxID=3035917 RepID=A0ABT8JFX1_9BACL|nr:interleukin-like EMT inducer domain-containing protein [Paenibacillus vandeheii]MDN4603748.1 interleukin-like EMT inducer domain-containing protein [Paenibacillus vandeheii]